MCEPIYTAHSIELSRFQVAASGTTFCFDAVTIGFDRWVRVGMAQAQSTLAAIRPALPMASFWLGRHVCGVRRILTSMPSYH